MEGEKVPPKGMIHAQKYKIGPGMKLFWCGMVSSICAFLCVFIAFCSSYWYQSWRRVHSPMANVGLWRICLSGYTKPEDPSLQSYVGCWWIHSTFFRDVGANIMPPWFRGCQALVIFTVLCNLASLILMVIYVVEKWRRKVYGDRYFLVTVINAILLFAAAFLVFIVSLVFAEMSLKENYFPRPWMNYLSWSFGFNVMSGFFSAFSGICMFIMAMILKEKLFTGEKVEREFGDTGSHHDSTSIITGPSMGSPTEKQLPESKTGESFV